MFVAAPIVFLLLAAWLAHRGHSSAAIGAWALSVLGMLAAMWQHFDSALPIQL
jgi:hypothetical protein